MVGANFDDGPFGPRGGAEEADGNAQMIIEIARGQMARIMFG